MTTPLATRALGAAPAGHEAHGDVLIGADGLHSALFGPAKPRHGGYAAWRAIARFDLDRLTPGETWGPGRRFGQWGMSDGRAYWYATQTVPEGQGDPPQGRKRGLLDRFRGWHAPIGGLVEATDESAILRNDIYDRPPLSRWGLGRLGSRFVARKQAEQLRWMIAPPA